MLKDLSQGAIRRPAMLGYAVAVLAVGIAAIGLALMQSRWQAAAYVSILLMAVIVTTRVGGAKPGLLASVLALVVFNYLLLHLPNPLADPAIYLARLLSLAVVSGYIVWITAAELARADSLRQALVDVKQNNEALRAENRQRLRIEEELRASEATFRALAENAPGAIFICQANNIRYANPTASAITGFSTSELCGRSFWENTAPDSRDMIQAREAARERGEPLPPRFEVKILTKAGAERWLDFTETAFEYEGKPAVLGIALDITERKHTEEDVRNSQQLLKQVLTTLPVGVAVVNRDGDIILGNAAQKRIWGETVKRGTDRWAQSKGWWHHSGKRIAPMEWASVRALTQGEISLNELVDIENFSGEHKTIQNFVAPIRSAEDQIVGAVIVNEDVTERVRAEEALHDSADRLHHLSRRLLAVQEEERRHLSRELHDEFGQLLATITLHLQAAKSAAGPAAQPSLNESIALLQRAGTQVRSLALELRPMLLETAGLDATLRWLAEQYEQRTGILTEVVGHVAEVSGEVAIAAFRVVQEALTNIVRHAEAQQVWIELSQTDGLLTLVIRDDGVGFDVSRTLERAAGSGNLGLVGMRERVELLGGNLAIESRAGKGSCIRVSFPLAEPASLRPPQTA
jgi:PAS domain S-box-containing protein